mgnify:CR=1 FL=1
MESNKIERLLDSYFEGQTSLEEEKILKNYFLNENVADHLIQYKPIFMGLEAAGREKMHRDLNLPQNKNNTHKTWWYSVAAMLVVALAVGGFYLSQPRMSQDEKEALAAFEKSREAMLLLSENLNKGTEQLSLVNQFAVTKNKYLK